MSAKLFFFCKLPFLLFLIIFSITSFSAVDANASLPAGPYRIIELDQSGKGRGNALAFSPDGSLFAVGTSSGIIIYDSNHWERKQFLDTKTWARSLAFSPDGSLLAAGLYDQTIRLFQLHSSRPELTLVGHEGRVRQLAFSPDGSLLVSISDDGSLRAWRSSDGALIRTIVDGLLGPRAIAVSPSGDVLAVGLQDGSISLFQLTDLTFIRKMSGHKDWVRCLAFSPDGKTLASGSFDKQILLWDVETGNQLNALHRHSSSVLGLAFSPDGSLLASSSVDQTVRIWHFPDGDLLSTLVGHTDFVYAAAFSPDGKTVASGSGDNTVRLWNVKQVIKDTGEGLIFPAEAQPPSISSDCRACHHPRGQISAPRVVDMSCESCHSGGAGLNWCQLFPRSDQTVTAIDFNLNNLKVGFPIPGKDLFIEIATPANGETLFANEKYITPVTVAGRVFSGGVSADGMIVTLEAWENEALYTHLSTPASPDGSFNFELKINPDGELPVSNTPGERTCHLCHDDPKQHGSLPEGEVQLVVTAEASDGSQASDARWIKVDIARRSELIVQVVDPNDKEALPGLSVQAHSVFYEWKDVYSKAQTDAEGKAVLKIPLLSQAKTTYSLSIPPAVLDGVQYSGVEPRQVALQPGEKPSLPVILNAHPQKGLVSGKLEGLPEQAGLLSMPIWAVRLPAGPAYQTSTRNNLRFEFEPLPISRYLVFPDLQALASAGLSAAILEEDLSEKPVSDLTFNLSETTVLHGTISQTDGSWLPFAWLVIDEHNAVDTVNPVNGDYNLKGLPDTPFVLTASAPGFYARSMRVSAPDLPFNIALTRRSDTRVLDWGVGSIIIPAETDANINRDTISLYRGWIWGDSRTGKRPMVITTPAGIIEISESRFALEAPGEGVTWLYILGGRASVTPASAKTSVVVNSGQMIGLVEGAKPMQMHDAILTAFHPTFEKLPVALEFEPTIRARLENGFIRAGISLAQLVAFAAYLITLLAVIVTPLALFLFAQKRLVRKHKSDVKELDK